MQAIEAYEDSILNTVGIVDEQVRDALAAEAKRKRERIVLIASENIASPAVMAAGGSWFTNKYAEGYPGRRYYGGCENVDTCERLARDRAKELFGADHANVQPHSGSAANLQVYGAFLQPGDTILAMSLDHGGHLSHGHKVNFVGQLYNIVNYGVSKDDERIDMAEVLRLAKEHQPKMIVCGASAYSRVIDFEAFRQVADEVGAYLLADIAHISGLVAMGLHPNPVPHADFVTTTTHKTLRGPRGGLILCKKKHRKAIDKSVFPGQQGGPLAHIVAAKAVGFGEALQPGFKGYIEQVVKNAQRLATALQGHGFRVVSGGTDNHVFLVDLVPQNMAGKEAEAALNEAGIVVNKNMIPYDPRTPMDPSGIRLGTPIVTTRGLKEDDMDRIAGWIQRALAAPTDEAAIKAVRDEVAEVAAKFPLWER